MLETQSLSLLTNTQESLNRWAEVSMYTDTQRHTLKYKQTHTGGQVDRQV